MEVLDTEVRDLRSVFEVLNYDAARYVSCAIARSGRGHSCAIPVLRAGFRDL